MKKVIVSLICIVSLFSLVLPLQASAWGGYMSINGEKTYHVSYCDELFGAEYSKIRWFNTKKQAESAGLSPCELCGAADWFDFDEAYETYFVTNDRKLDAAFDAVCEYGAYIGEESAFERFQDQYGSVEEMEGYSFGYEEGYYQGYNKGREEFASATYIDGFNDGYSKLKAECDDSYQKGFEDGYKEGQQAGFDEGEGRKKRSNSAELLLLIVTCVIAFFFGKHCKQAALESDLEKCRAENMKLSASLKDQNDSTYILEMIARKAGSTTTELAQSLFINFRKAGGYTEEAARAELQKEKQNWPQSK